MARRRTVPVQTEPAPEPRKIELRPIDDLIPYANNPKQHPPRQISQIAALIMQYGWTQPILVDGRNGVIAGHGRLEAAQAIRRNGGVIRDFPHADHVPVIELGHMSEAEKRAYIIADNKVGENGEWDNELLGAEIEFLQDADFDIGLTGFSPKEIEDILDSSPDGLLRPGDAETGQVAETFGVVIECKSEMEQAQLLDRLLGEGLTVRALM